MWDWTTSELLVVRPIICMLSAVLQLKQDSSLPFDPLLSYTRYQFGLLDPTCCFVTSINDSGSIRLYRILRSPPANAAVIHLATLQLPPTSHKTYLDHTYTHTGPIEATSLPHMPFKVNDDDRLHVFTLWYDYRPFEIDERSVFRFYGEDEWGLLSSLDLFVHQRVFMKYCTQLANHGDVPLDIPWEEWGPPNTRIICPARVQRGRSRWVFAPTLLLCL